MSELKADDVMPVFLPKDVALNGSPVGIGDVMLTVTNLDTGDVFELRGFEYSLARMFDGRRTAGDVLAIASRLGLDLTLDDLDGFVRKLDSHAMLRASESSAVDICPWSQRVRWDEMTRDRYRAALRAARHGEIGNALETLNHLLNEAPPTEDAARLRDRLAASLKLGSDFSRIFTRTRQTWLQHRRAA